MYYVLSNLKRKCKNKVKRIIVNYEGRVDILSILFLTFVVMSPSYIYISNKFVLGTFQYDVYD